MSIKPMNYFDSLVLSGGASKGLIQLGVLHYYHTTNNFNLDKINEFAGASIGSVICLLLIVGYTPLELFKEVYLIDFNNLFTTKDVNSMWDIFEKMGMISIQGLIEKIEMLVRNKLGELPSLKKLFEITGKKLYISGTNVSKMKEDKFSPDTTPELSCIEAIKISCNIPLIFHKSVYKGNTMVDGGILNNFPVDYISKEAKNILAVFVRGEDFSFSEDTFLGYFYRLTVITQNAMTDLRCRYALESRTGKTLKIININWKDPVNSNPLKTSSLPFALNSDLKSTMFMRGVEEAKKEDTSKDMIIDGWAGVKEPEEQWNW